MDTWDLPGVPVFQAGIRRGKQWTEADIDQMAANYSLLADRLSPPIVIGHGDEVDLGTAAPKLGEVVNPRKEFTKVDGENVPTLVVDFKNIPAPVAELISNGIYDRLSPELQVAPEVYDEAPEGCERAKGPILRRVALLGGELPQIKTLGDLTALMKERGTPSKQSFSERLAARPRLALRPVRESLGKDGRVLVVFSEFQPEEKPVAKKCKPFAELSDATKATLKKFAESPGGDMSAAGVSRDDLLAMLSDMGMDPAMADGASDAFLSEVVRVISMTGQQAADEARDAVEKLESEPVEEMSDEKKEETPEEKKKETPEEKKEEEETVAMSEKARTEIETLKARLDAAEKRAQDAALQSLTNRVEAFCEKQQAAHKLSPAAASLFKQVLPKVNAEAVYKFGESETTTLDAVMKAIEALPAWPFGEKVPGANVQDDDLSEIIAFSEKHANALRKSGRSPDFMVETFKKQRANDPTLTAKKFLGSPAA